MDGHQIELAEEARQVDVVVDGVLLASSTRALVLLETGLPARHYIPQDDVRMELLDPTPTETVCPFKGSASYWTLRIGDAEHRDVAWSYESPIDEVEAIAGRICFYGERADHVVDGELLERPVSPWSPSATA